MAAVEILALDFFDNGAMVEGYSVVGVDWGNHNRIARYKFRAPATGSSSITAKFTYPEFYAGNRAPLAFFVGVDPDSHTNGGANSPRTGLLNWGGSGANGFQGGADVFLSPGQEYYFWIFPSVTTYDCWVWQTEFRYAVIDVEGSSGGAYIGADYYTATIGGAQYLPYIGIGGEWKLQG